MKVSGKSRENSPPRKDLIPAGRPGGTTGGLVPPVRRFASERCPQFPQKLKRHQEWICQEKGSAAHDIVMFAAIIVFVLLPVFSVVFEKYAILSEGQIIKDALDVTNISSYMALNNQGLGKNSTSFDTTELWGIYEELLAKNLNLEAGLMPKGDSVAEGPVKIESLICYTAGFPAVCPDGGTITRPAVHSCITVPVRPLLFRQLILGMTGKQYFELKIHVDSEIPINN